MLNAFRRALVVTHRWLGVAGGALFAAWFVSGVAMMYSRMPRLPAEERLRRLTPLDLTSARVSVDEALQTSGGAADRVRVGMLLTRPVYRIQRNGQWTTVFADSGERLSAITENLALQVAGDFAGLPATVLRHDGRIVTPDQWTLQLRALLPAHRIRVNDPTATVLYVGDQTGDVVLRTTRQSRTLGYVGAVVHWLYFRPLRQNGVLWSSAVIWASAAGCVLSLSGLVWGVWQLARTRRSAYTGLMKWHHYLGLAFGLLTFTFVFSGLLSMEPLEWSPGTSATRAQRDAVSGGPLTIHNVSSSTLRSLAQRLTREFEVKEIDFVQFRGRLYAEAYQAPAPSDFLRPALGDPGDVLAPRLPLEHRLIAVDAPEAGTFVRFSDDEIAQAARAAMPDVDVHDETWLESYDAYYYDRHGRLPLPVLRVRYADSADTWLYVDPRTAAIVRKEERLTRINRWLYHGFHSFDWPWLYQRRPLWDVVVILISAGGLFVTLSSAPAGWRRVVKVLRGPLRD